METISISRFKATCLGVLEEVRRTGRPVLVTKRGVPVAEIVPPSSGISAKRKLGMAAGTIEFLGDIVAPPISEEEWETIYAHSEEDLI